MIELWWILEEWARNSPTFRFLHLPAAMSGLVVLELWVWPTGVCWLGDRTAGSTSKKTLDYQPVTVHSQREQSLSPPSSTRSVSSSSAQPQFTVWRHNTHTHTHTLDTTLARGIPVCGNDTWELLLCSCSIWVLAFRATLSLRTSMFSGHRQHKYTLFSSGMERRPIVASFSSPQLRVLVCII